MAEKPTFAPGRIGWVDLTVPDAGRVSDFYQQVAGWTAAGLDMGGYQDYVMSPPDGSAAVAGVCHARGGNTGLPPVWLVYITVADLDESLRRCDAGGGKLLAPVRNLEGHGRFAVIEDPAGAAVALFQPV
jgi:uncharacterized protein